MAGARSLRRSKSRADSCGSEYFCNSHFREGTVCHSSLLYKVSSARVVYEFGYCTILDSPNGLIDDEKWNKEPLTWNYWLTEAIFDLDVELCASKDAMDDIL